MRVLPSFSAAALSAVALLLPLSSRAPSAAAPNNGRVAVLSCSGHRVIKPASNVMSCADANSEWEHVHWSSWGPTSAHGVGELSFNDCVPSCVAGSFRTYHATVTLSRVEETARHGRLFTKADFSYVVGGKHMRSSYYLAT